MDLIPKASFVKMAPDQIFLNFFLERGTVAIFVFSFCPCPNFSAHYFSELF